MDALIAAAARALASSDPFGALNRVALRNDAPALALRGIALAQLGELDRAKALLRRAARSFGSREALARARCVVAQAEIALVTRMARQALARAAKAARAARIPALVAEVESALRVLDAPAARLVARDEERLLLLEDVEAIVASKAFVVDACRNVVRYGGTVVPLRSFESTAHFRESTASAESPTTASACGSRPVHRSTPSTP